MVRAFIALVASPFFMWQAYAAQWDATRFEYEPGTGRLVRKVYADGKAINYTYHYGNLPKRITQASGKWMERFYDGRLNVTSNVYSSENTPDVHIVPNEFGTPFRVVDTAGLVYEYGIRPMGQLLTNETVTSPWMDWSLGHSHDQFSRETGWTLSVDGEEKGMTAFSYGRNGKISQMTCVNAAGRSFSVNFHNPRNPHLVRSITHPFAEITWVQIPSRQPQSNNGVDLVNRGYRNAEIFLPAPLKLLVARSCGLCGCKRD